MSATVNGGLFAGEVLSTIHTRSWGRRAAARVLSLRQNLALQELMITLNGATSGSAASKTLTRVSGAGEDLSGVRAIETVTLVSRNTDAADVTDIAADILTYNSYDGSPVANGDGNPLGGSH